MLAEQHLSPPENPYDYQEWTNVISKIDVSESASMTGQEFQSCVELYSKFLETFPWLYAYWTKYANLIYSGKSDLQAAKEIFNKALSKNVLYYSVEMWLEYIMFFQVRLPHTEQDQMRTIFCQALDSIGTHYHSGEIWSLAMNFESEHKRPYFHLLAKSIAQPTDKLDRFWSELQSMLPRIPVGQLISFDLSKSVTELTSQAEQISQQPPRIMSPQEEQSIRAQYTTSITDVYNSSLAKLSKVNYFEININRHFFHFNSPDDAQIGNWEAYSANLEKVFKQTHSKSDFDAVVQIYERALIPCAFIDSIWLHYASFLEDCALMQEPRYATIDDARNIYLRIPMAVMPSAKVVYGEFEEVYSPEKAVAVYTELSGSYYAEQIIAAAYYTKRTHPPDSNVAQQVLAAGRDRLLSVGDRDGASVVAAVLLDLSNEASEGITGAAYTSKYARRIAESSPQQANELLFNAIFPNDSTPLEDRIPIEDRVSLFPVYIEFNRKHGMPANFQMSMELNYNKLKNKLTWHRNYFDQTYLIQGQQPEQKAKMWADYQSNINDK
ncbi:hypothetical protein TRFO_37718 [Tritrichomonas foetus]|uniref:Suppressor of forked domain-containing protein n=1 Tax=Tritrichomonas foetus TaxID=1144522 RepID=A0A1J4JCZ4_9EUKA|nr:hypothetical protein TRFO_37718 [Tritrichomonas foetus]|eukprot:OHS96135.1 hypothetical protein TRFO_37718 [Tritrichomonas foetus]